MVHKPDNKDLLFEMGVWIIAICLICFVVAIIRPDKPRVNKPIEVECKFVIERSNGVDVTVKYVGSNTYKISALTEQEAIDN